MSPPPPTSNSQAQMIKRYHDPQGTKMCNEFMKHINQRAVTATSRFIHEFYAHKKLGHRECGSLTALEIAIEKL